MKVIRISKEGYKQTEMPLQKAIDILEGGGYCKKDTVAKDLEEGLEVHTPFAIYRKIVE